MNKDLPSVECEAEKADIYNPPTPLAVQGVVGAGQARIIVSQSSHRNQFIALLGGAFFGFGEKRLPPRGPWGRAFWRYIFGLEPKQAKKKDTHDAEKPS